MLKLDDAYHHLYHEMEGDWCDLLDLAHGDTLPVIDDCFTEPIGILLTFSEACERRWANEAPAQLYLRQEAGYIDAAAWLYDDEEPETEMIEARTKIFVVLDGFWSRILQQPQRHEKMTMTPFVMVWRLLECHQKMAEAGEGHTARIDRLLDLLLKEEFAGLFPMVLTKEQWTQIFLADFEVEDCKMLYVMEMEYYFIVQLPVYRAA
ncbi:hypothetical protein E4U09_007473 [Claviceps aff. purpurea]|uniref:Uncharacterized protein n=1 Tax=Claviceps aff. purpurea TaxID=1967640 RepID=A0A9P7QC70_9HYPO|nr:hypothetical protein E4U09_007473 [Claviceps aff. purpurea]